MALGNEAIGTLALGELSSGATTSSGVSRLAKARAQLAALRAKKSAPYQSIDWSQPLIEPAPSQFANREDAAPANPPHAAPLNETDAEIKALMHARLAALEREAQGLAQAIADKGTMVFEPAPASAPNHNLELSLILLLEAA